MDPIDEIAAAVGGTLLRGDGVTPTRIVHDSREVREGDLFVALRGSRADGHAFLEDAFARGACGALVSDPSTASDDTRNLIVVDDTLGALQRLASAWRRRLGGTLVGITGSNGKTTTRALLAHVLSGRGGGRSVSNAPRNYNTEVGLPLALLAMPETAAIGLFELGADRPGDIATLADLLVPDVAVVTSIGPSHLDGFGTVDAVAREKWSLVERLPANGFAVLNVDSPHLRHLAGTAPCRCVTVGLQHGAVRGRVVRDVPNLELVVDDPPMRLVCPLIGEHNAMNLLLAAATAVQLGISPDALQERAETFEPVPHRLRPVPTAFGTILDDTYNANPASAAGALACLAQFGGHRTRRAFVFGEMRDLGPDADRHHDEILALANRLGIDAILPVGEQAIAACRRRPAAAVSIVDRPVLAEAVRALCQGQRNSVVLVKGSRSLELERLVAELAR